MIIILSSGKQSLIDDEDYSLVMSISKLWSDDGDGYAIASYDSGLGYRTTVKMHRIIMGLVHNRDRHIHVDHISNDKSDNRKCNLRIATPEQNGMNVINLNPDKGIYYIKSKRRFVGSTRINSNVFRTKKCMTRDLALWALLDIENQHLDKNFAIKRLPYQLPTDHPNYKSWDVYYAKK